MGNIGSMQLIMILLSALFVVVPFWKIFPRAGWSPALSLLMVIPLVNLVLLWALAFKSWPGDSGGPVAPKTFE